MANPEHLEIINRGVEVWNKWRVKPSSVVPDLSYADLPGADLPGADLGRAGLSRVNLSRAYLNGANLSHAILLGADLSDANLSGADLGGAALRRASLRDAYLARADLSYADLSRVDLSGANLRGADISGAHLKGTKLRGANFTDGTMGSTTFADNDLSEVRGLETVQQFAPSSISIDTIYKSRGNIPEVFLRGSGVPEDFITYMRSLTVKPIQFYTCFISYTEADDAFSERLYNDLQAKGVRCWRWKEDAKWGEALMRSVDEAVRVYDKLIIICSEQSLNSPAVIREIERALQKEDDLARQGEEGEVLFPIRLDDYIFTGWQHHRKADVTAKNVGDFRKWKDHDSYQKAFDRLLRDLKAEGRQAAEG